MLESIKERLTHDATSSDLRVIILRANGPVFSSGHNLKELVSWIRWKTPPSYFRAVFCEFFTEFYSRYLPVGDFIPRQFVVWLLSLIDGNAQNHSCSYAVFLLVKNCAFKFSECVCCHCFENVRS